MMKLMQAAGQKVPEQKLILSSTQNTPCSSASMASAMRRCLPNGADLLLEQAQLAEQGGLQDPSGFVARVNRLLMG